VVTLDCGKQEWQQSPIKVLLKDNRYQQQRQQQMLSDCQCGRGGNNVSARRQQCYSGECVKVRVANCKVLQGWEDSIEPAKQAKCTLYVKQYHV
jgi:hypothetical protein